ncbi:amidohydrolase family protein [Fimbriimonas ginsengisoli]|uniref:Amidohydrolase containing protein n=1 Tax=Fimbriimonas ginsengisoli Gsoil 348 TaxID=661478 RepID=A0A068NW12_FIMGI|nr:amidohydrolase family protein [Fimbriimonas ginsengisoli]AIE85799.1 amidohydrolase containing protein [Fimbriimonas ginsengisoli Gsoil 348]
MSIQRMIGLLFVVPALAAAQTSPPTKFPVETNTMRKSLPKTGGDVFIKNGKLLTASHGTLEGTSILVRHGKIASIGKDLVAPEGITVIDATGKVVSPGIVDAHVHRGIDSTNEGTDAIVGEVRILDVLNPDAKTIWQAAASGETTGMILHGSANPIGGQSQVIKFKYGRSVDDILFPGAPRMIKFALGENVTRSGNQQSTRFPHTRLGVEAVYRRAFTQARDYMKKWDAYDAARLTDRNAVAPQRDLRLETLADILRRKIWVQCHSYRASEILMMVRLSQEFGFKIGAMQHALESYKIAPELAKAGVGVSIFEDDWAGKLELYDCIPYAAAILTKAGANVSINTDGVSGTTALILDAAKTMRYGGLTEDQALRLVTMNPARELGVDTRVGSLDIGKDADIVVWDGHPLSTYSRVNTTLIDGEVFFQRRDAFGVDKSSITKTKLDPFTYVASPAVPKLGNVYAIVGATIHPVLGPTISNGIVLLEDGKIKAVGNQVMVPKNAIVVDARKMHVYPGFIDAGTTIGLSEFGQVGQASDAREFGTNQPDLVALTAVQSWSEHLATTRCVGVTSVFTCPRGGTVSGQGSVINTAGWTNELMGVKPKAALCLNWPGGGGGFSDVDIDTVGDNDGDGSGSDKNDNMGGGGQGFGGGGDGTTSDDIKTYFDKAVKYGKAHDVADLSLEAMQPYISGQLPVFIRVRDRAGIIAVVEFVKKYKLKAVVVDAPESWKEAKLLADNHIPVILSAAGKTTLSANTTTNDWDPYDTPYATPALLKRAGVKFCFMSDSYADAKNLPERVGESCAYGLSREDAVRALTLSAAEILGVSDKLGSITPGKTGNLVITDGDPFEMTSNIRYVFVDGKPVRLESKFTRLRDMYLQRVQ